MHIRRADKHSLNPSKSRARSEQRIGDLWRISDQSYITWSRRVASVIGAEHTLFMSDDAGLLFGPKALEAQGSDGFFRHVPAPASCVPSRSNAPGETKGREQHGLADRTAIQPSPRRSST